MGANDTLYPYALSYMRYIIMFLPVAVFSNYIAIFVRADGDPNRAMAGVLLGGVVNIVLDIVFVFPCKMGIGGAALASALGMVVQVTVGITHFFSMCYIVWRRSPETEYPAFLTSLRMDLSCCCLTSRY